MWKPRCKTQKFAKNQQKALEYLEVLQGDNNASTNTFCSGACADESRASAQQGAIDARSRMTTLTSLSERRLSGVGMKTLSLQNPQVPRLFNSFEKQHRLSGGGKTERRTNAELVEEHDTAMIGGADCRSVAGPTNHQDWAFILARTVHRPTVSKTHEQFDCVHVS